MSLMSCLHRGIRLHLIVCLKQNWGVSGITVNCVLLLLVLFVDLLLIGFIEKLNV